MFTRKSSQPAERRMVPLRYVLMPFFIILIAAIFLMVMGALAPKPAKKPVDIKAPLVEVQPLSKESVTFLIASQGNITPRTQTSLISEVSGQVVSVSEKFNVGGFFKKGEQLLAIDDINYQVALVQAQARLGTAKANLAEEKARTEQAQEEWLLSGKSLDDAPVLALRKPFLQKAKAEVKAAEADLKQAKVRLERTKIVAPYDAMIKEKKVDIGQYVSTGAHLAVTFAVDYAEVRLPVKQRDILFLDLPKINQSSQRGSSVELHVSVGTKEFHWQSEITRYEGVVDNQSRVHYVVAQIDDPYALQSDKANHELRVGTFVKATITGSTIDNVIAIPRSVVTGANTIYLLDENNKLHIQAVNLIHSDSENIYTQDNLDLTKQLITTKLATPIEAMSLRVKSSRMSDSDAENNTKNASNGDV